MMPKETKRDTLPGGKVARLYPDSQSPKRPHHRYKHTKIGPANTKLENNVDEYELESIPPDDDRLSVFSIRPRSPSIEIIKLPPPINNPSRLAIDHPDGSSSILLKKPTTYRSFLISPNSQLLREVSSIPTKKMPIKDKNIPKSSSSKLKKPLTFKLKPVNVRLISLGLMVALALCIIIILSILLSAKRKEQSLSSSSFISSACAANCMMSITPFLSPTIASWPFDGSLSDLNNIYSTIYTNPPTVPYIEGNFGQAIDFNGAQYLYSSTQFMNLSYQSWTIEGWVLIDDLSIERGIFGQCQSSTTTDKCLNLSIKNKRLHLSFYNNDLDGITSLTTSSITWHHVAFVYDYTLMQQSIYLDGVLEATTGASGVAVGAYKGTSGAVTIGWTTTGNYFDGRIDHLQVSSGAKTACQILNDATLIAYYAFDVGASYLDSSNNFLHGIANSLITVPGRVNHAYSFQDEYSYFQSMAFTAYYPNEPFSVALWVKPFVVTGGTLIHLSTVIDGTSHSCFDLLGFSSSGQLIGQVFNSWVTCCTVNLVTRCPCQGTANVGGPIMVVNIWTHIVLTYSVNNGLAIYTNGTLQGVAQPFSSFPTDGPDYEIRPYMTVGNRRTTTTMPGCIGGSPSLSSASYQGLIDELRLYSRELTKTEICSLFHT